MISRNMPTLSHSLLHVLTADKQGIKEHCGAQNVGSQEKIDLCSVSVYFSVQMVRKVLSPVGLGDLDYNSVEDLDAICSPNKISFTGDNKWVRCCDNVEYPDRAVYTVREEDGC